MKRLNTYGLLVWLVAFISLSATAQRADALIDRDEILIGEQAVLSLSCRMDKNDPEKIEFPTLADTVVDKVEIVSRSEIDTLKTSEDASETRLEQRFYITCFDTGYYVIPPFEFKINGEIEKTEPLLLGVETVEIDTTASIKGAKPNYEVNIGLADYIKVYWPYAAGVLGLAALATILFIIIKKRKSRPVKHVPKPEPVEVRPPHVIALERLEKIKQDAIYKRGLVKQYHTEITDTIRDFIESQFNIHTHEQTSKQIIDSLKYTEMTEKSTLRLRTILFRADMVKFAKFQPESEENKQAVEEALQFVKDNEPEQDRNE